MQGEIYNKKAKRVYLDGIYFDSKLEASFYSRLIKLRDKLKVHICVHYPLRIQGKVWKVDFALFPGNTKAEAVLKLFGGDGARLFIEIKGVITASFISQYQRIIDTELDREVLILSNTYRAILCPVSFRENRDSIPGLPEIKTKIVYPLTVFFKVLRERL